MSSSPIIESVRLLFVELSEIFAEQIFEYASDEEVTRYVAWNRHSSINDTFDFLEYAKRSKNLLNHNDFGLILKETNEFIGTIGTTNYQESGKSVDFGYVLNKKYWHKGLATEAAKAMCQFAFIKEGVESMNAYVFEENLASCHVLEKCNFTNSGPAECPILDFTDTRIPLLYTLNKSEYFDNIL